MYFSPFVTLCKNYQKKSHLHSQNVVKWEWVIFWQQVIDFSSAPCSSFYWWQLNCCIDEVEFSLFLHQYVVICGVLLRTLHFRVYLSVEFSIGFQPECAKQNSNEDDAWKAFILKGYGGDKQIFFKCILKTKGKKKERWKSYIRARFFFFSLLPNFWYGWTIKMGKCWCKFWNAWIDSHVKNSKGKQIQ